MAAAPQSIVSEPKLSEILDVLEGIRQRRHVSEDEPFIVSTGGARKLAELFYVVQDLREWQLDHLFLTARILDNVDSGCDEPENLADPITVTDPTHEWQHERESHIQELTRLFRGVVQYSDGGVLYDRRDTDSL